MNTPENSNGAPVLESQVIPINYPESRFAQNVRALEAINASLREIVRAYENSAEANLDACKSQYEYATPGPLRKRLESLAGSADELAIWLVANKEEVKL